jgi:hypothetical protein
MEYNSLGEIEFDPEQLMYKSFDMSQNQEGLYTFGQSEEVDNAIELAKQLHIKAMSGPWIKNK